MLKYSNIPLLKGRIRLVGCSKVGDEAEVEAVEVEGIARNQQLLR